MQHTSHALFHRRAKIVATIGPATKDPENLKKAIAYLEKHK